MTQVLRMSGMGGMGYGSSMMSPYGMGYGGGGYGMGQFPSNLQLN